MRQSASFVCGEGATALIALPRGGLIILRMLDAYVDSSGTLIPALWVPLDFFFVKCTLVIHTGTSSRVVVYENFGSGRVIPLFKGCCSADNSPPLIGVLARFRTRRLP
jgi:hypothetical protein